MLCVSYSEKDFVGSLSLVTPDVVTDGSEKYKLTSPVLNGSRIDDICKDVLECSESAKNTNKCEDCNQSTVITIMFSDRM